MDPNDIKIETGPSIIISAPKNDINYKNFVDDVSKEEIKNEFKNRKVNVSVNEDADKFMIHVYLVMMHVMTLNNYNKGDYVKIFEQIDNISKKGNQMGGHYEKYYEKKDFKKKYMKYKLKYYELKNKT